MHTTVVVVVVVFVVLKSEDVDGEYLPCSVAFSKALPLSVLGPTTVLNRACTSLPLYFSLATITPLPASTSHSASDAFLALHYFRGTRRARDHHPSDHSDSIKRITMVRLYIS